PPPKYRIRLLWWRRCVPDRVVSKYEVAIERRIDQNHGARLQRREPFELNGKPQELEVFRLPIDLLRYNIRNGRFAAELKEREAQLSRRLSPEVGLDALEIEKLLLKKSDQAEWRKADINSARQLRPG